MAEKQASNIGRRRVKHLVISVIKMMLVLGAQSGLVLGTFFCRWFPYLAEHPTAFAVVGMAAFFSVEVVVLEVCPRAEDVAGGHLS